MSQIQVKKKGATDMLGDNKKRQQEIIDRLVEIEKKQSLEISSLREITNLLSNTNYKLLEFIKKEHDKDSKKISDDEFDKSMQNKDGLYSRNAITMNKKRKEEEE